MSTERDGNGERYAGPGRILREAADVESLRDFAEVSWQEAVQARGQSRRRGLVTVLAAAVAGVLAIAFLPGDEVGPDLPAGPTDEVIPDLSSTEIFRFAPQGDVSLGDAGPGAGLRAADLEGMSWALEEVTSTTDPLAEVIGSAAPTVLTFPSGQEGTMVLEIGDCGQVVAETVTRRAPSGLHQVGAVQAEAEGCSGGVQQAVDYWSETLSGQWVGLSTEVEGSDDKLVFTAMAPQTELSGPTESEEQAPETTPLGGGLSLAVPDGWQAIYRGSQTEGQFTTCLVPDGGSTDPTQHCDGVTITTGLTEQTRPEPTEFFAGDSRGVPCYPDPNWPEQNPEESGVSIDLDSPETGTVQAGPFQAQWQRWEGECEVDGATQRFRPQSWWIQVPGGTGALATSAGVPEVYLGSVLDGIDTAPEGIQPVTLDARVDGAGTDLLQLSVYGPDDGPVGAEGSEPSQPETYTLSERTQCLLHDTAAEPGVGLHLAPCVDLTDWLAAEVQAGRAPLVTVITDQEQRLLQVRTLYLP